MVQITLKLAAHPQRGLVRHSAALVFHPDTLESPVFYFRYTCHSHVLLSFTHLSLVGHLVSKVSSKLFIMEGLRGQLLKALTSSLVFNNYLTFFHLYVTGKAPQTSPDLNEDTHFSLSMIAVYC